jgi:hypothetical protein
MRKGCRPTMGKNTGEGKKEERFFVEEQNKAVLWGFFIFNFNNGILVIMHPKTMLFWVFYLFNSFI